MMIGDDIRSVLLAADPREKVMRARSVARDWQLGRLEFRFEAPMPVRPARPDVPLLLPPNRMPSRRRGGSQANRIAMLHAFAHIEFVAIDLAFDAAGRFGPSQPREFVSDWLAVGADEAMHFALLRRRLIAMGSDYGALPAHDGLWEPPEATRGDLLARLAVVPMVLEARGLDVSPATIRRLESAGDRGSARILDRIYRDEIRHVATGSRWFVRLCESAGLDVAEHWQSLVRQYFRGPLKPPFNDSARSKAGLPRELYASLASAGPVPQ